MEETHNAEEQVSRLGAWQAARDAMAKLRRPITLTGIEAQKHEFEGRLAHRGNVYTGTASEYRVARSRAKAKVARRSRRINRRRSR